jgi:hypothetical protein
MWVFRREVLDHIHLESPGMPLSEEIKLDVIDHPRLRFGEYHIDYSERIGETKLFAWKDGVENELFLFKLRLRRLLNPQSRLTQRSVQYQPRISPKSVRAIPEPPLRARKD